MSDEQTPQADEQTPAAPVPETAPVQETAPTQETALTQGRDLSKCGAGSFDPRLLSGAPADAVKRFILMRAGIGADDTEVAGLADVRLDFQPLRDNNGALTQSDVERVPDPFPPAFYTQPLKSVADWLTCVDAVKLAPIT